MKTPARVTYTVRGIAKEVDTALRRRAAQRKQSLNQVIVEQLSRAAGTQKKADFSDLVGTWEQDPGFDEIVSSQRKIDARKWK